MDEARFNQLLQGLQALTAQIQAQANAQEAANAAAAAAPPAVTAVSPYEGGPLDLQSRVGSALFSEGSKCLEGFEDDPYDGKPERLYSLIAALKGRSAKCKWDAANHNIVSNIGPNNLNLFKDYGRLT